MALTLAEAKRRCTLGRTITLEWHRYAEQWGGFAPTPAKLDARRELTSGRGLTRTIGAVQGSGIAFQTPDGLSWLTWPKAAEFRAIDADRFEILEDGAPLMRYRIGADL